MDLACHTHTFIFNAFLFGHLLKNKQQVEESHNLSSKNLHYCYENFKLMNNNYDK